MDVREKALEIISKQLGVDADKIGMDASFTEDLGADSLDIVELIMAFEETFNVEIPDEDAEKLETVVQVIDYVANKMQS
ncbi:MAG TPA: acyl carrier protein [Thermodesulfovibrionia bacterium]|nr:acyl carrier protein [Thermodesulfovibrionia bacterium]